MAFLRQISNPLLTVFYPQECTLCGESVEAIELGEVCESCWEKSEIFDGSQTICFHCGLVLANSPNPGNEKQTFCRACDELSFAAARAIGIYDGALRAAVLKLKREPAVSEKLKELFFGAFNQTPINEATKIVAVPLHEKRFRERSFNQAAVLAECLSKMSGLEILENCLIRSRHTQMHRAGMDERGRRESVEKSFEVKNPRLIENEKILLVDDVFTSGATASACAKILKEKGASEVFVLTIARTF
ncbi:MAG: ComF family protein [Acidobacteriota bacterium]|nr:ComF family protein [Acidobacteriota bacterium]